MPEQDPYAQETLESPANNAEAITGDDDTDVTTNYRAIYVGGAGNIKVDMAESGTVTFNSATAGTVLPIRVKRVYATGTTATNLIGLW